MNPFDAVGTARVSQAIADRMCRVVLGYQDEPASARSPRRSAGWTARWVDLAVALTRATREHRDVRMGSSVRGAIDLALVLTGLADLRGEAAPDAATPRATPPTPRCRAGSGSPTASTAPPESVLDELLDDPLAFRRRGVRPDGVPGPEESDGQGKADGLPGPSAGLPAAARAPAASSSAAHAGPPGDRGQQPRLRRRLARAGRARRRRVRRALAARTPTRPPRCSPTRRGHRRAAARGGPAPRRPGVPAARPRRARQARGTRRLGPSRGLDGDLDLDRTIDGWEPVALVAAGRRGRRHPRTWTAHRRAVCLVVDISGSMKGLAVALAVGGRGRGGRGQRARRRRPLQPSVVAFGAGVKVLQAQGVRRPPEELLSRPRRPARARHDRPGRRAAGGVETAGVGRRRTSGWSCCSPTACTPRATTRPRRWAASTGCTSSSRSAERRPRPRHGRRSPRAGAAGPRRWRRLADIGPALTRILA